MAKRACLSVEWSGSGRNVMIGRSPTARIYHSPRERCKARPGAVSGRRIRLAAGLVGSGAFLLAWIFPIVWSVLNSFKTEQDVLAYPPKLIFSPS